ncbi:MAG TPA: prepilin-type N-terminal cleavage/methylation domain-containing protein [Acidimicrobiales bacterium]
MAPAARHGEGGFSLLETVVAITIAAVVFAAAGGVLVNMVTSTLVSRQNQRAADLASETLENLRGQDYGALAMVATDLNTDVTAGVIRKASATQYFFDSDNETTGASAGELVVTSNAGIINPHITSVKKGSTTYRVAVYATRATDSEIGSADYKRLTVRVSWQRSNHTHKRQTSTLVTRNRRGLPLPHFTLAGANVADPVPAGSPFSLWLTLTNRGARDAWNIANDETATPKPAGWTLVWYEDVDGNRAYTAGVDTPLPDTTGDSIPDTGYLQTDEAFKIVGYVTTVYPGTTGTVTFNLVATPTSEGGASSAATKTESVQITDPGTGCTSGCAGEIVYYLHNNGDGAGPGSGSTSAFSVMGTSLTAPTRTSETDNYDTGHGTGLYASSAGRWLEQSATATTVTAGQSATFYVRTPSVTPVTVNGTAKLFLCAAVGDFDKNKKSQLSTVVYKVDSIGTRTQLATDTKPAASGPGGAPKWNSPGFRGLDTDELLEFNLNFTFLPTDRLEVVVSSQTATGMHLMYDAVGCKATFTLATTS